MSITIATAISIAILIWLQAGQRARFPAKEEN